MAALGSHLQRHADSREYIWARQTLFSEWLEKFSYIIAQPLVFKKRMSLFVLRKTFRVNATGELVLT